MTRRKCTKVVRTEISLFSSCLSRSTVIGLHVSGVLEITNAIRKVTLHSDLEPKN
jgi:hypothetical protein